MSEPKRNPDGTVALPEEPKIRHGIQIVFYYKDARGNAPEAFATQVITYFPEEGDSAFADDDGTLRFYLKSYAMPTTLTVAKTWDYMVEYDVKVKAQQ